MSGKKIGNPVGQRICAAAAPARGTGKKARTGRRRIEPLKLPEQLEPLRDLLERCQSDPDSILEPDAVLRIAELQVADPASEARAMRVLKEMKAPIQKLRMHVAARLAQWRSDEKTVAVDLDDQDASPPHLPKLVINDATIEKLAVVIEAQPRGALVFRDEASGWLGNMSRYANGGSDRPFWTEGYGGRPFVVERLTRPSVSVGALTISIMGGIQPDKLNSLLLQQDDDGFMARFLVCWPEPAPIVKSTQAINSEFIERAFERLYSRLPITPGETGPVQTRISFDEAAQDRLLAIRRRLRELETDEAGLMVSVLGKMSGVVVRLAFVLAHLDWATSDDIDPPREICDEYVWRAQNFVFDYALPMARRAYAEASVPMAERGARMIAHLIVEEGLHEFSLRDITRRERQGLRNRADVEPALDVLVQASWIQKREPQQNPNGGRRRRDDYYVNPRVHELARTL